MTHGGNMSGSASYWTKRQIDGVVDVVSFKVNSWMKWWWKRRISFWRWISYNFSHGDESKETHNSCPKRIAKGNDLWGKLRTEFLEVHNWKWTVWEAGEPSEYLLIYWVLESTEATEAWKSLLRVYWVVSECQLRTYRESTESLLTVYILSMLSLYWEPYETQFRLTEIRGILFRFWTLFCNFSGAELKVMKLKMPWNSALLFFGRNWKTQNLHAFIIRYMMLLSSVTIIVGFPSFFLENYIILHRIV